MKVLLLFPLLVFLNTFQCLGKYIPGALVRNGDTIAVEVKVPFRGFSREVDFERLQRKIKYIQTGGKQVARPANFDEARFVYRGESIRMISVPRDQKSAKASTTDRRLFLRLIESGHVRILSYSYTTGAKSHRHRTRLYLQRRGEALQKVGALTFKKQMTEYFSDCASIAAKIQSKDYRQRDIYDLVKDYNSQCP